MVEGEAGIVVFRGYWAAGARDKTDPTDPGLVVLRSLLFIRWLLWEHRVSAPRFGY